MASQLSVAQKKQLVKHKADFEGWTEEAIQVSADILLGGLQTEP